MQVMLNLISITFNFNNRIKAFINFIGLAIMVYEPLYHALQIIW